VLDHLRDGHLFEVDKYRGEAEAANPGRRELRPAHRFCEQLRRFHAWKDNPLSAGIERPRHQMILHVGHADDRAEAHVSRDAADILDGLDTEAAVLGVHECPMKSRRDEDSSDILRPECSKAAAELDLPFGKGLLYFVDLHL